MSVAVVGCCPGSHGSPSRSRSTIGLRFSPDKRQAPEGFFDSTIYILIYENCPWCPHCLRIAPATKGQMYEGFVIFCNGLSLQSMLWGGSAKRLLRLSSICALHGFANTAVRQTKEVANVQVQSSDFQNATTSALLFPRKDSTNQNPSICCKVGSPLLHFQGPIEEWNFPPISMACSSITKDAPGEADFGFSILHLKAHLASPKHVRCYFRFVVLPGGTSFTSTNLAPRRDTCCTYQRWTKH